MDDLSNFAFFQFINVFLRDEIDIYTWELLTRFSLVIGTAAFTILTLWILIQGFRIVSGQSRDSLMVLVVGSLKNVFIIGLATSIAAGGSGLYYTLTDGLGQTILSAVAEETDPYKSIDRNLAVMTLSMAVIDKLQDESEATVKEDKSRAQLFTGIGIAGPAVIASSLLLLNKLAMALFIGFGPLFILMLMFEQTKAMFSRWLFYGIGTIFSLAVLTVMVSLTTKVVGAVAAAFLAKYVANDFTGGGEGINSMAMQQGGLGLVMSTLIIMTPPMAASFFQGALGNFVAQSSFGQIGRNSTGQGYDAGQQNGQRPDGNSLGREDGGRQALTGAQAGTFNTPSSGVRTTNGPLSVGSDEIRRPS